MNKKPNILLIFTDQQRGDTIHALGNNVIQTPNMDRLCNEGTSFERAYTPSPVCVPGRCSLYYGLYPYNTGCYDNGFPMPANAPSMMSLLTQAGYRTHGIGKMHFTPDHDALSGFETRESQEEVGGTLSDAYEKYLKEKGYNHIFDAHGQRSEMYYIPQISQLPAKDHPTNWIGDRSVEFLKDHDYSSPFFLMSSFVHPHPPFAPPTPWNKEYRAKNMPHPYIPEGYEECITYQNHFQNRYKYRDQGIDKNMVRTMKAFYYACISFVDYQIGRIVKQLEDDGQLDNTLIILTSDHGEMLGDYNCFGKRTMLDSAARIPMIVRYPALMKKGQRCNRPTSLVDVMPTILSVSGIGKEAAKTDGESLFDVATGKSSREYIYSQFQCEGKGLYMIATEKEKYIYSAPDDKEYYFDKNVNNEECVNLAKTHPAMEDIKNTMLELMRKNQKTAVVDDKGWVKYPTLSISKDADEGLKLQDTGRYRETESILPEGYSVVLKEKRK